MPTIDDLNFEIERRVIILHRDTTMPDNTQLAYVGDPNNAIDGNTPGETLLYRAPSGTIYLDKSQDPNIEWTKTQDTAGGIWAQDQAPTSAGDELIVDKFILTATDISNKYVIISEIPNINELRMDIAGAPNQDYGTDYIQNSLFPKQIQWSSLGLEGLLEENDIVTVTYTKI